MRMNSYLPRRRIYTALVPDEWTTLFSSPVYVYKEYNLHHINRMPLHQPLFYLFGRTSTKENFAFLNIYKTLQTNLQEGHLLGIELVEDLVPETFR